ncbi:MAG: acyl carrier protein [Myxococcota bacterium]|jgi:acyl carrier protein|nr:acyl carrier protein [Myxococcota bacterium]
MPANQLDPTILAPVRTAFAEALGLDESEVRPESRLIADLGAESLDFLDIAFRLERAFDVRIPRGGIEQAARADVGDSGFGDDGVLTTEALERLAAAMPEVPRDEFRAGLSIHEIPDLFRVETFHNLVVRLLDEQEQRAAI